MSYRLLLMCLLGGGLLVSCQSPKSGSEGSHAHDLADNGGYSQGGFYGDSSAPAPSGYPQDGQSFETDGGVPFSHSGRGDHLVEPVVAEVPSDPMPAPSPAPVRAPRWGSAPAPAPAPADAYASAYPATSYAGDHGSEQAVVTPYVERVQPVAPTTPTPSATKPKTATTKTTTKKAVATAPKKKSPTVATAGSKRTGTTVKTVYKPVVKGKATVKKKAVVTRVHDVKRGDSLSKLASRYGVTVAHLKKRNKLTGDTIVVGKRLTID